MVLLRTLIESPAIAQIAGTLSSPGARQSLSVLAPLTFLSSAPAPHPRGAADSDDTSLSGVHL